MAKPDETPEAAAAAGVTPEAARAALEAQIAAIDAQFPRDTGPVQKFRVIHGAVSGVRRENGVLKPHDFHFGDIVDEKQLDGHAALYFSLGALEPIGQD